MKEPPNCLIIDVKKEYRQISSLTSEVRILSVGGEPKLRFNPLSPPPGVDASHWDRAFADGFTRGYGLAEPSRRILLDSLFSLRQESQEDPTLRQLERRTAAFQAKSSRQQNSQASLESRLHLINTGPVGESLNTEEKLNIASFSKGVTVLEIGDVDSLKDQRFLAELLLMHLWMHDKYSTKEADEKLKRLVVIEEAHRYLSEERPPEQKGERTLLELAIAEARRYGWGFLIIDQMPRLLSKYVWDNVGTVIVHRMTNRENYDVVERALGHDPTGLLKVDDERLSKMMLRLPEYLGDTRHRFSEASYHVTQIEYKESFAFFDPQMATKAPPKQTVSQQSSGSLFCRNCGVSLPPDSKFCNKCGTQVA